MNTAYPFAIDHRGRTQAATYEDHVAQMIEQLLFTAPGERVNRPTFGCGLRRLLFEPNRDLLAATTSLLVQASLQQWMATIIDVLDVDVEANDSTLSVSVSYTIRKTGDTETRTFTQDA